MVPRCFDRSDWAFRIHKRTNCRFCVLLMAIMMERSAQTLPVPGSFF